MSIELAAAPDSRLLTTVARVQAETGITGNEEMLTIFVEQASSLIESWAGMPLYRAQWIEKQKGSDSNYYQLWRLPLVSLETASLNNSVVADVEMNLRQTSLLYRSAGFPSMDVPTEWSFQYTAGWIVPAVDLVAVQIPVIAADKSYNSTGLFPKGLRPGDVLLAENFQQSANNGLKIIVSATVDKIIVQETLVNESGGNPDNMRFSNLPSWIERVAIDLTKTGYSERSISSSAGGSGDLKSIKIGDASMEWDVVTSQSTTVRSSYTIQKQKIASLSQRIYF